MNEMTNKEKYNYYLKSSHDVKKYGVFALANLIILFICWLIGIITYTTWLFNGQEAQINYEFSDMNYNDVQNDIGLVINGTFIVSMVFFSLFGILYIVQIVFYIILAIKVNKLKDIYQNSQLMSILFIVSIFIPIVGLISSVYVLSNSIKIINRLQAVNVNDLDNSSDPSKPILPTNPPSPYPF